MDLKCVGDYGRLMDKMQVTYTNIISGMEGVLFRNEVYVEFLDDMSMRKLAAILKMFGQLTVGKLAEKSSMSPKCIHRPLKKLEERGLIKRTSQNGNKKNRYVSLTDFGIEQMELHSNSSRQIMLEIFNGALDECEQREMVECTAKLFEFFDKCDKFVRKNEGNTFRDSVHFSFDLTEHTHTSRPFPRLNKTKPN